MALEHLLDGLAVSIWNVWRLDEWHTAASRRFESTSAFLQKGKETRQENGEEEEEEEWVGNTKTTRQLIPYSQPIVSDVGRLINIFPADSSILLFFVFYFLFVCFFFFSFSVRFCPRATKKSVTPSSLSSAMTPGIYASAIRLYPVLQQIDIWLLFKAETSRYYYLGGIKRISNFPQLSIESYLQIPVPIRRRAHSYIFGFRLFKSAPSLTRLDDNCWSLLGNCR
jgi:hypothetical protein